MILYWRRYGKAGGCQNQKKIIPQLCRLRIDNKTGVEKDANPKQQGSAEQIELVLPVIREFKRLRFLMTDKISVT